MSEAFEILAAALDEAMDEAKSDAARLRHENVAIEIAPIKDSAADIKKIRQHKK